MNEYPERQNLKILFLRQSEGVYTFGRRKVYVKIDKNKQVLVRVGGGYMDMADFIEQYTHEEVEKIDREDTAKRFQQKLQV